MSVRSGATGSPAPGHNDSLADILERVLDKGIVDRRRHRDQRARHRAADDQAPAADRVRRQGARDGDQLVGVRPGAARTARGAASSSSGSTASRRPRGSSEAARSEMAERALYVYGVAAAADAVFLPRGRGAVDERYPLETVIEGRPGRARERGRAGRVRARPARPGPGDLAWLERRVRAHEGALASALGADALVPFRFGTVVAGRDELRALLRERAAVLRARLEAVRGADEWGVRSSSTRRGSKRRSSPPRPTSVASRPRRRPGPATPSSPASGSSGSSTERAAPRRSRGRRLVDVRLAACARARRPRSRRRRARSRDTRARWS